MPRKPKSSAETEGAGETATQEASNAAEGESLQGFFTRFFDENPKYLKVRSNEPAFNAWLAAHPGETEIPQRVKNAVTNAKSHMRKKKKSRKGRAAAAPAEQAGNGQRPAAARVSPKVLQTLEEQIDNCLAMAKSLDVQGLEEVIQSLRRARNEVIVKQGGE